MKFDSITLLLSLVVSHLLADFTLQSGKMEEEKYKGIFSPFYCYHILIVGACTITALILVGYLEQWWHGIVITLIHALIDLSKGRLKKDGPWIFIIHQLLHLLTIVAYWLIVTGQFKLLGSSILELINDQQILLIIAGYILVTLPTGILIGHLTKDWQREIEETREYNQKNSDETEELYEVKGLANAGKLIGVLERILILTFILLNEFRAIGFLLAAKSVFRFGDLKDGHDRKRTEYILIGTLLSFTFSIAIGLLISYFGDFHIEA